MPIELFAYSLVMSGLGMAVTRFSPELSAPTYSIVLMAVVLGVCLGMLGLNGRYYRKFTLLSLLVITLMTVALNVTTWTKLDPASSASRLAVLNTSLMVFFSIGLLITNKLAKPTAKVSEP